MNKPILSICIPTCKREDIVEQLIDSIIQQKVDASLFEICITDNSDSNETEDLIRNKYFHISNLHYKKVECEGFLNSIEALKFGNGQYLKLHNDTSIFYPNSLMKMIDAVFKAQSNDSYIYFSMGEINLDSKTKELFSYDEFMRTISLYGTWSSSFGIYKKKFEDINNMGIVPNFMYPHTSYLHRLVSEKSYIIDNNKYTFPVKPKKKGGYNLVDNFVRIYLTMVGEELLANHYISEKTYNVIMDDILKFCADWFYNVMEDPDRYNFSFENDEEIVLEICDITGLELYKKYKHTRSVSVKHYLKKFAKIIRE